VKLFLPLLAGLGALLLLILATFYRRPRVTEFSIGAEGVSWGGKGDEPGMEWTELRRVKPHPELCVITLMDAWHVVARLQCTPLNYDRALELVRYYGEARCGQLLEGVPETLRHAALSHAGCD
jgi:hypothetical protein